MFSRSRPHNDLDAQVALDGEMRTRLHTDLESIQPEAQQHRVGKDLHDQAAAISDETVDAVAAVVSRLDYGQLMCEGFSAAMISDAATAHLRHDVDRT